MALSSRPLRVAFRIVSLATEHDIKYPAVAVAYYAFVALLPLLVLVLAVVGEPIAMRMQIVTPRFLTPEAQELVYRALSSATGRAGAAALAIVVLAWSGANVTIGFQTVVERVEGVNGRSIVQQLRDAVGILGSLALAAGAIVLTGFLSSFLSVPPAVDAAVLIVALTGAFVPLYYVPSRTVTTFRAALPGAFVSALGWSGLLVGIRFYAVHAGRYAVYGVLSGIIIILTSLYIAAIVLMLSVIVNAALLGEDGVRSSA